MSRAMEEMERPAQTAERLMRLIKWIDEMLIPWLESRQDADFEGDPGSYKPNDEMELLSDLEAILGRRP